MNKRRIGKAVAIILLSSAFVCAIVCRAYREKISAHCFESADRRYRETGKHPGGFDWESCDKYAGGLLFKYRAALFFNKRNYDAVWELLDTLEACRGKQAVLDEAEKMYKDEPNDVIKEFISMWTFSPCHSCGRAGIRSSYF